MKQVKIDGPSAVVEFAGNVKHIAAQNDSIAAAWLDKDKTLIAVKLPAGTTSGRGAAEALEKLIGKPSLKTHFSSSGIDIFMVGDSRN